MLMHGCHWALGALLWLVCLALSCCLFGLRLLDITTCGFTCRFLSWMHQVAGLANTWGLPVLGCLPSCVLLCLWICQLFGAPLLLAHLAACGPGRFLISVEFHSDLAGALSDVVWCLLYRVLGIPMLLPVDCTSQPPSVFWFAGCGASCRHLSSRVKEGLFLRKPSYLS